MRPELWFKMTQSFLLSNHWQCSIEWCGAVDWNGSVWTRANNLFLVLHQFTDLGRNTHFITSSFKVWFLNNRVKHHLKGLGLGDIRTQYSVSQCYDSVHTFHCVHTLGTLTLFAEKWLKAARLWTCLGLVGLSREKCYHYVQNNNTCTRECGATLWPMFTLLVDTIHLLKEILAVC